MPLDTNLHKKAYAGDMNAVEELLSEGEDVNARGAQNRTPLQRAAGANMVDVCKLLLSKGADPNLADEAGRTTLHWAALGNAVEVAGLLLEKRVDIGAKTKSGSTALHLSAEAGKTEFVQWLIKNGAAVLEKDGSENGGQTAYQLASQKQQAATMDLLKQHGGAVGAEGGACCVIS